ncbi:multiple epidermal growth factor-like domains protein 10 isoform X2 [Ostrea edulis]|uniref:multiple epidermal growth factor-like domains protein 10 isoform X2 n=1 Tax=Ostrea edulis TaxID=37623 RepID=UPI0024AF1383|nr:multiple epidermal growth factor-like domains protein 10 isoform X2 [Ostrea edulis]
MMVSIYLLLIILMCSYAYDNLALRKPTWQLHQYGPGDDRFNASNAVDGLKSDLSAWGGQCVISNSNELTATWRVDLQDILSIRHITIYYRTDNVAWGSTYGYSGRFLGFSLYISNTTDRTQGELCFHDTNFTRDTIPAVLNVTCLVHGQYVIYYNERLQGVTYPDDYSNYAFNELCEVEVYGCPSPGYYGTDCSLSCPDVNCKYCHIETGACQGCNPGYKGYRCEQECDGRKYGEGCQYECGKCKDMVQCHHINGTCLNECEPGFKEGRCVEQNIALHKPAWQRSQFIPGNAIFNASNAVDGLKSDLSAWGGQCVISNSNQQTATWRVNLEDILSIRHITIYYRTDNTAWECENGKYGEECQEYCGHCTDLAQCDHVNGTCLSGCNPGFKQGTCKDACDGNEYGEGCQQSCGSCLNSEQCHHVNGSCLNGCNPGYQGETCKEKCEVSLYGDNCSKSCGHCLRPEQCDNINGTCKNGCKSGFQGTFCNETCMMGTFGEDCRKLCNVNCKGCDTITGICDSGCYTGWKGSHCSEECDNGKYGAACGLRCGDCLGDIQCDHVNGSCFSGCNEGFRGPLCKEECSVGSYGKNCLEKCNTNCGVPRRCNKTSGECEGGCQPGWRGTLCDTKCGENLYGPDCNQTCGKCREGNQCHHVSGSCNEECEPGYRGNKCNEVCEFGHFGASCRQECSVFCQKSRACHHVTGVCRDGCKSGWRGDDCLEVDNQMQEEQTGNNWETMFYGILGAFCVTLVVIGVLVFVLYKMSKRHQMDRDNNKKYQASDLSSPRKDKVTQDHSNENVNSAYQELGELSSSSPYDSIY